MQKLRPLAFFHEVLDVLKCRNQGLQVMPVNRSDVVETKIFKQRCRHDHALGMRLQAFGQFQQRRRDAQDMFAHIPGGSVEAPAHELGQIAIQRAYRRADAHVVVIEHHQQLAVVVHPCVVQRLKGHARTHGPVANDGHRMPFLALLARRQSHAQRGRN